MVLEVAPGVLGGTGGATVTSGPLEAIQDTPVPMSATQQRLENKSYPSRSRTASEASSERRGSGGECVLLPRPAVRRPRSTQPITNHSLFLPNTFCASSLLNFLAFYGSCKTKEGEKS